MPFLLALVLLASLQVVLGHPEFSDCLGESVFVVVDESLPFDEALTRCEALGGDLAVPFNEEEHDFIMEFVTGTLPPSANVWLGLKDEADVGGTDPSRFQLIDTFSDDTSFFTTGGSFPWDFGEPNDSGNTENCVELRPNLNGWNDKRCNTPNAYVCRRPCTRVFQGCLGESEFLVVGESVPFDEASTTCAALGGDVAVPFNRKEHEFIMDLITGNFSRSANFWLGFKDEDGSGGPSPSRFQLQDTFSDDTGFFDRRSIFPWACDEPNDAGSEDCVELRFDLNGWNDKKCSIINPFVCRRTCLGN